MTITLVIILSLQITYERNIDNLMATTENVDRKREISRDGFSLRVISLFHDGCTNQYWWIIPTQEEDGDEQKSWGRKKLSHSDQMSQ